MAKTLPKTFLTSKSVLTAYRMSKSGIWQIICIPCLLLDVGHLVVSNKSDAIWLQLRVQGSEPWDHFCLWYKDPLAFTQGSMQKLPPIVCGVSPRRKEAEIIEPHEIFSNHATNRNFKSWTRMCPS